MTLTHGDSTLAPASGRHCRLRWTTPLACTAICMSGMAAWMQNSGNATRLWLAWVSGRSSGSHIDQGSGRTGGIWIGSPIVNPEMCIARAMAAYHSRRRALGGVEVRFVEAEHGRMPTVPSVYQDVFRFLRGRPMQLARTPGGPRSLASG